MKRKARTELGGFSASAIDLFASALGAFIIITVMLFPYFPNLSPDPLQAIIDQLRTDKAAVEATLSDQKAKNKSLTKQNSNLKGQVSSQAATIQTQKGQIASAQAQASAAKKTASTAQAAAKSAAQAAAAAKGSKDRQIADLKGQLDGTAFIGVEPKNHDFQLVLDMSGSIKDYKGTVQKVVREILSRMDTNDNLRISTYQGEVNSPQIRNWPSGSNFKNSMSPSDRAGALNFVNSALSNAGGFTPTFKAMDNALSISKPTTIILLTDGVPQVLPSDVGAGASPAVISQAVQNITARNSGRHQINMVAIGAFVTKKDAAQQVQAIIPLATRNGGVLVALP